MKSSRPIYALAFAFALVLTGLPAVAADAPVADESPAELTPAEPTPAENWGTEAALELLPEPDEMMGPPACKNKDKFTTFSLFVLSQAECEAFCESSCAAGGGTVISVSWVFRSLDCGCTCCKT